METTLLLMACNLYGTSPDQLVPLSGGHYNAVYQFPNEGKHAILRIGVEDCPPDQTLAMLEWVRFVSLQGGPVAAPLPSIRNRLLENLAEYGTRYTITAFEKIEGTLAENIPPEDWTDELFTSIGQAAGKLHRISVNFKPLRRSRTRPLWFDSGEILHATSLLDAANDPASDKLFSLIRELHILPTNPVDFGLIHGDLHFANFLIAGDGEVSIIDFDDCAYGWFAMDVAMALFDVLVLYNPADEADSQRFASHFLSLYLAGYRQEKDILTYQLELLPVFLKLKELCVYASLIGHADITKPDSWVGRFMRNRSERIAEDIPYVDIDFANF